MAGLASSATGSWTVDCCVCTTPTHMRLHPPSRLPPAPLCPAARLLRRLAGQHLQPGGVPGQRPHGNHVRWVGGAKGRWCAAAAAAAAAAVSRWCGWCLPVVRLGMIHLLLAANAVDRTPSGPSPLCPCLTCPAMPCAPSRQAWWPTRWWRLLPGAPWRPLTPPRWCCWWVASSFTPPGLRTTGGRRPRTAPRWRASARQPPSSGAVGGWLLGVC